MDASRQGFDIFTVSSAYPFATREVDTFAPRIFNTSSTLSLPFDGVVDGQHVDALSVRNVPACGHRDQVAQAHAKVLPYDLDTVKKDEYRRSFRLSKKVSADLHMNMYFLPRNITSH